MAKTKNIKDIAKASARAIMSSGMNLNLNEEVYNLDECVTSGFYLCGSKTKGTIPEGVSVRWLFLEVVMRGSDCYQRLVDRNRMWVRRFTTTGTSAGRFNGWHEIPGTFVNSTFKEAEGV